MDSNCPSSNDPELQKIYFSLVTAFGRLADVLMNSAHGGQYLESANKFGDVQLDTDIKCEDIINDELRKTGSVKFTVSEETPEPKQLGNGQYIVTFDPLDGSSIVGSNFTVGSIVGIWKGPELIGQKGKDQVGACCCIYGPRTTALFYNDISNSVDEWTMINNQWSATKKSLKIKPKGNLFAPGNLRAVVENENYKKLVDHWIMSGYTLRYTGGLVPDVYQIFMKGQGVMTNIASQKYPAKLRYLYEVAPLSFLVEKAGGKSWDGKNPVLDAEITNYVQTSQICVGSEEEINRVIEFLL